ncbi:MAG: UvrD-helicase domain-containing protein [candidate division WOR-3 bacterium]|nr:MAG: UvrD-helicase domain-containing protein [candidate division WOR-3 bacterium]
MTDPQPLGHTIVLAPAGSGKTQKLSDRYISLLENGVKPERILTITFTRKAAAEMKERILSLLHDRNAELYKTIRQDILKLRIMTIDAFCNTIVRRFAADLGLDPRVEVIEDPSDIWTRAKYDTLMQVAERRPAGEDRDLLLDLISSTGSRGWPELSDEYDGFFSNRAIVRAVSAPSDTDALSRLAAKLQTNPLSQEKLESQDTLFPETWTEDTFGSVARALEEQRSVFLRAGGDPRTGRGRTKPEFDPWAEAMADYRAQVLAVLEYRAFSRKFGLFRDRFLDAYHQAKKRAGLVDFPDLEHRTYDLLANSEDWQNILRAFDEHTDHLLVDEFQDTSFLQWGIIDKLTEEWRSGEGAKTELGIMPTVFLVGDDKQSIYFFRGAKVEVFARARNQLRDWLGKSRLDEWYPDDNFRSLQSIIDFNNALFSRLMSPSPQSSPTRGEEAGESQDSAASSPSASTGDGQDTASSISSPSPSTGSGRDGPGSASSPSPLKKEGWGEGDPTPPWRTRYIPFKRRRDNRDPGLVELLLFVSEDQMPGRRQTEAELIARRIRSLVGSHEVWEVNDDRTEHSRPCECRDIGILLRKRTHLPALEQALREAGIPFIVDGGVGFWEEPEVGHVLSLLRFLADPADDLSLYAVLRGPLFRVAERELFLAARQDGPTLFDRLHDRPGMEEPTALLRDWLGMVNHRPLAHILATALEATRAWEVFWEPQRAANVRKLLRLVEDGEFEGLHPLRILDTLKPEDGSREPKAAVPTEGRNAVNILTVHRAKGLQFRVVFFPGLDVSRLGRNENPATVVEELDADTVWVSHITDPSVRNRIALHREHVEKQREEDKRLFYVACTRARDALILTGAWIDRRANTWLEWLEEHLGLAKTDRAFTLSVDIPGLAVRTPDQITVPAAPALREQAAPPRKRAIHTGRIEKVEVPHVEPVSRNIPHDYERHPEDLLGLGDVIHRILELLSIGRLKPDAESLTPEITRLLRLKGMSGSRSVPSPLTGLAKPGASPEGKGEGDRKKDYMNEVLRQVEALKADPDLWAIVAPKPNSESELPFMLKEDGKVWSGRIDRLIITDDEVLVYDYKTFSVGQTEIPELAQEYHEHQLQVYARAAAALYPDRKVKTFLLFTSLPALVPTG